MNSAFSAATGFGVLVLVAACSTPPEPFDAPGITLSAHVGAKDMDSLEGLPDGSGGSLSLDEQVVGGLELSTIGASGFGWEIGGFLSGDKDSSASAEVELTVFELDLGGRYTHTGSGAFLPYFGGGLALLSASADVTGSSTAVPDSTDWGFYAHTGVNHYFSKHLALGVDLRGTFLTDDLDGIQVAGVLSWGF